jgi:hypothetical protein
LLHNNYNFFYIFKGDTTTDGGGSSPITAPRSRSATRFVYTSISDNSDSGRGASEQVRRTKVKRKKKKTQGYVAKPQTSRDSGHVSANSDNSSTHSYEDYCGGGDGASAAQYLPEHSANQQCSQQPKLTLLTASDVEDAFFDEPTVYLSAHTRHEELTSSGGEGSDIYCKDETVSLADSGGVLDISSTEEVDTNYEQAQPIPSLADMYMDISEPETEIDVDVVDGAPIKTADQQQNVSLNSIILKLINNNNNNYYYTLMLLHY